MYTDRADIEAVLTEYLGEELPEKGPKQISLLVAGLIEVLDGDFISIVDGDEDDDYDDVDDGWTDEEDA
jgi:hypothetical protein